MSKEKNLELDRLVFFSDAVVAIAITLLALDLRFEPGRADISFNDIAILWPRFAAFTLSFVLIAVFWKIHHEFFFFIRKIDSTLLWYNIFWLFFIVILPFSTTLVSGYFKSRQQSWQEPLYRDVWGLLREFGDAEIASLIAPRGLVFRRSPQ